MAEEIKAFAEHLKPYLFPIRHKISMFNNNIGDSVHLLCISLSFGKMKVVQKCFFKLKNIFHLKINFTTETLIPGRAYTPEPQMASQEHFPSLGKG